MTDQDNLEWSQTHKTTRNPVLIRLQSHLKPGKNVQDLHINLESNIVNLFRKKINDLRHDNKIVRLKFFIPQEEASKKCHFLRVGSLSSQQLFR